MALGWKKEYFKYKVLFSNILNLYKERNDLKMFLEILLSLVTISLFGTFALRPTFLTIAQLLKDIKTKEETIIKMETKIQNLEQAQITFAQESTRLLIINASLPESAEPQIFIRQIEGIADKNSVAVLGISVEESTLKGKTEVKKGAAKIKSLPEGSLGLPFSLNLSGSYQNLSSFLNDLDSLRRPILLETLSFTLSKTSEIKTIVLAASGRTPYLDSNVITK